MSHEIEILENMPTKIRYKNIVWIPEETSRMETNSLSSEKIRCWLRFKNIQEFKLDDLRVVFPEWSRYARSQLIFKINPLIKKGILQQLGKDEFKVLKLN